MKIKAKILSPIHISSGEEYEKDFNFFINENEIYVVDEFKVLDKLPKAYDKKDGSLVLNEEAKQEIINNNLYKRKMKTNFQNIETFKEAISLNTPYIPASSIKGAIRTAILDDFEKNKKFSRKKILNNFDKDLINIFKNIIVRDVYNDFKTQIYKTINIKICKNHQEHRTKTEEVASFVESLIPHQEFLIEILDKKRYLNNLANIANQFYKEKLFDDIDVIKSGCKEDCENLTKNGFINYFYKQNFIDVSTLVFDDNHFVLNIGRFSGAVKKSLDNVRYIKNSKCKDKKFTTTKTFALEKSCDNELYENCLIPFGWIYCEILK